MARTVENFCPEQGAGWQSFFFPFPFLLPLLFQNDRRPATRPLPSKRRQLSSQSHPLLCNDRWLPSNRHRLFFRCHTQQRPVDPPPPPRRYTPVLWVVVMLCGGDEASRPPQQEACQGDASLLSMSQKPNPFACHFEGSLPPPPPHAAHAPSPLRRQIRPIRHREPVPAGRVCGTCGRSGVQCHRLLHLCRHLSGHSRCPTQALRRRVGGPDGMRPFGRRGTPSRGGSAHGHTGGG